MAEIARRHRRHPFEALIPQVKRRHRYPGRKRLDDRKVLTGILFVLWSRS